MKKWRSYFLTILKWQQMEMKSFGHRRKSLIFNVGLIVHRCYNRLFQVLTVIRLFQKTNFHILKLINLILIHRFVNQLFIKFGIILKRIARRIANNTGKYLRNFRMKAELVIMRKQKWWNFHLMMLPLVLIPFILQSLQKAEIKFLHLK